MSLFNFYDDIAGVGGNLALSAARGFRNINSARIGAGDKNLIGKQASSDVAGIGRY